MEVDAEISVGEELIQHLESTGTGVSKLMICRACLEANTGGSVEQLIELFSEAGVSPGTVDKAKTWWAERFAPQAAEEVPVTGENLSLVLARLEESIPPLTVSQIVARTGLTNSAVRYVLSQSAELFVAGKDEDGVAVVSIRQIDGDDEKPPDQSGI